MIALAVSGPIGWIVGGTIGAGAIAGAAIGASEVPRRNPKTRVIEKEVLTGFRVTVNTYDSFRTTGAFSIGDLIKMPFPRED